MSFLKRLMFAICGNWSAAFAVGIVSVGAATVIAIMAYAEFQQLKSGKDDARWSVFELGFEYQRFMLAAERGESLVDMRMRGDIYMSRVLILRDAPLLAHVREGIGTEKLQALFKSAHETDRLLQGLDNLNQRGGLGPTAVIAEFDGNGQATNLQAMSASELYLASYARKPAGPRG